MGACCSKLNMTPSAYGVNTTNNCSHPVPDCTDILYPCREALIRHMDTETRSAWRLVNKRTCQDVSETARSLIWRELRQRGGSARLTATPSSCLTTEYKFDGEYFIASPTTPLSLIGRCQALKQLHYQGMVETKGLRALQLPPGLEVLCLHSLGIGCSHQKRCTVDDWCRRMHEDSEGAEAAACLASALRGLSRLQQLRLDSNYTGPRGAAALAPAIAAMTTLRLLDLSRNILGPVGAAALAPAVRGLAGLQELRLDDNWLADEGMAQLAPSIGALSGLQHLSLDTNFLGPEGATALAAALRALPGLQSLHLAFNPMGAQGAAELAHALPHLPRLQHLNLGYLGKPGRQGAAHLAPALKGLTGLRSLNLRSNAFGAEGAAALSPALQALTALTWLSVAENGLGVAGVAALAPALAALTQLQALSVGANALDKPEEHAEMMRSVALLVHPGVSVDICQPCHARA